MGKGLSKLWPDPAMSPGWSWETWSVSWEAGVRCWAGGGAGPLSFGRVTLQAQAAEAQRQSTSFLLLEPGPKLLQVFVESLLLWESACSPTPFLPPSWPGYREVGTFLASRSPASPNPRSLPQRTCPDLLCLT